MRRVRPDRPPRQRDLLALARLWRLRRPACILCERCVVDALSLALGRGGHRGPSGWDVRSRALLRGCSCPERVDGLCTYCRDALVDVGGQLRRGEEVEFVAAIEYLRSCGGGLVDCYCAAGADRVAPPGRALTGEPPP